MKPSMLRTAWLSHGPVYGHIWLRMFIDPRSICFHVLMSFTRWFGTTWEHPEDDESKYQTFYSRAGYNPRGYGPRGSTRTTLPVLP